MSTATEISRLQSARNTIRDKLIVFGLATSTDKLDDLATAIDGIANRGAVSASIQEGDTYTIPAGYHNGSGTVSGVSGGGNYTLQTKTVTPTKSQQSVTADNGYYGLAGVTVEAIPEAYQNVSSVTATAGDVLSPKVIVAADGTTLTGTMVNNGAVSRVLDATASNQTYTVPTGYHNGSGAVSIVLEQKTATPSETTQTVVPTTGKVLSQVTVNPIPGDYVDVSDANGVAADVLSGVKVYSYDSTNNEPVAITGSMTVVGAVSAALDTSVTSYTVPAGYHNGNGTVTITLEEKSATPTTSAQNITPTSGQVLSKVVVNAIPAKYGDTTGDDAVAANLLAGKVAHTIVNGTATQIEGTMVNNGAVSKVLDATSGNQSYTVPGGFHNGSGSVSIALEQKTVTPATTSQTVTPTTGKVLSSVTVNPIPSDYQDVSNVDAVAGDVLSGKTIVAADGTEITGSMANNGAVRVTLDATTNNQSYTVPTGYHSGTGTVSIVLEEKSGTPSTTSQTFTASTGKVISQFVINAIPSNYGDVTGDDGVAANVLAGVKVHTVSNGDAVQITGTMANNGAISGSIDGFTTTSYTVPSGYTSGGSVSLTNDIELALAAI